MPRDFGYDEDIAAGVLRVADRPSRVEDGLVPARGLNIGNHEPVPLLAMTGFAARASIDEGLGRFVAWYLDYYRVAR